VPTGGTCRIALPHDGRTLLVGVDGGNTKTVALVAEADGTVVGSGWAGCSDLYNAPSPDAALDAVRDATAEALTEAGATGADVAAACFGLAGADWPEDFEYIRSGLQPRLGLGSPPMVVNDAIGAIRAGTPDGVGVSVVIGTYGIAGARNAAGEVFHLGFWPDSTGARPLGRAGLEAVWRFGLGTGPETSLTARALELYGAETPLGLLHDFTRRGGLPAQADGKLAAVVLDEADAGDPVAYAVVERQARILAGEALACARMVGMAGSPFRLVLTGGVMRHPSRLLGDLIAEGVPEAEPVRSMHEPVIGSLLFAFDHAGIAPDAERLRATAPSAAVFDESSFQRLTAPPAKPRQR
jgi:N-acetylglucosamine kinase-like BadF-type ATPase